MNTSNIIAWGILAASVLLMAFAAASEASVTTISRTNVRRLLEEGVPRAQALQTLLEDPWHYVTALMILKGLAFVAAAGSATLLALDAGLRWPFGVSLALLLTVAVMLGVQVVARATAIRSPETAALRLGGPLRAVVTLLSPVVSVLRIIGSAIVGRSPGASTDNLFLSEDGLRFLINVAEEPGLIEEDEKEMIASIFEFSETVAREVMIPRIDIVAVEEKTSLQQALDIIISAGHSRIPVFRETVDNIQGLLYAKDLLPPYRDGRHDISITELMRPAYFVPESKKVDDLLRELQQRKVHMAIVVDEYGGTAGVATIEDLVEEIVGEIQDEYDSEAPMTVEVGQDEYLFDARIGLDEAGKVLGIELPDYDSDTLGGFIYSHLGRMPVVGSQVTYEALEFRVESVSGRRIQQVRVTRKSPNVEEEAPEVPAKKSLSAFSSLF